jgi:CarD family transcriptional regulator
MEHAMDFKIGDYVVHPAYGVGQVERLEERRFTGADARLYYKIDIANGTVWVPVQTDQPIRLRPITTKVELARYRKLLVKEPIPLNPDHRERQQELSERLKSGSFKTMCEVVRDLTARSWEKSLNEADSSSLRKAREALCQEWAASKGISLTDADQEVEALLVEARHSHEAGVEKA